MKYTLTQGEQNLVLLQKSLPENEQLYLWSYSMKGELFAAMCPEKELLDNAFRTLGGLRKSLLHAKSEEKARPLLIGSSVGMHWVVMLEPERNLELLFVIGPVFYQKPYTNQLRESLKPYINSAGSAKWAAALLEKTENLPVMSYSIFTRYATILYNALGGRQQGLDALLTHTGEKIAYENNPGKGHDRWQIYLAERAMLQMVKNGDISYQHILQSSINLSDGVPVRGKDPLRQTKTSITVFITLVSRAAMEGGLSPEIAYSLGDSYIQAVEDCNDSGELSALASAMYHDFIYRVHHLRNNPNYSPAIQKCCDYIELSLERKVKISDLAALVGYSDNYLGEKFKKETGLSANSYIMFAKIERAKVLLTSSNISVRELSENLAFNTINYFIECFKKSTGYTPVQYRKRFVSTLT